MIKVTFRHESDEIKRITFRGHAEGYGEEADRIICASVSTIFYNLCAMLREYPSEAFLYPFKMKEAKHKNGMSSIEVAPSKEYEQLIFHDLCYAMVGFETVAMNYPAAVEIVVKQ